MAYPVFHSITVGETLVFEVRFVGEDMTDATPSVVVSAGMTIGAFTLTKVLPDTIVVIATSDLFSPGTHDLHLWLSWPSGDVREEIGLSSKVGVKA